MTTVAPQTGRRLPVWGFVLLVIGYLAAVQLIPATDGPSRRQLRDFSHHPNPWSAVCG